MTTTVLYFFDNLQMCLKYIYIYIYLNIIKYYQIYLISISILFRFFVFPRIQNLQRLIAACDSVGACPFLVPGDQLVNYPAVFGRG